MSAQALYQRVVESKTFNTQAEAIAWGKQEKEKYKQADIVVKVDTVPIDATRRQWKTQVYMKT